MTEGPQLRPLVLSRLAVIRGDGDLLGLRHCSKPISKLHRDMSLHIGHDSKTILASITHMQTRC